MSTNGRDAKSDSAQSWGVLTMASIVTLGAVVQESNQTFGRESYERYVMAVCCISLIVGIVFFIMSRWTAFAGTPNLITGTIVEVGATFVLLLMWSVALGIINDKVIGSTGLILNANIYYFSWIAFISNFMLFANSVRGPPLPDSEMTSSDLRYTKWSVVVASSTIVMASATGSYRRSGCKFGDLTYYCKISSLAIGMGCGTLVLAMVAMLLIKSASERNQYLQIETLLAFTLLLGFAVSVGYITGAEGPGSIISNLYYFTWICFISTLSLLLDCVNDVGISRFLADRGGGEEQPSNVVISYADDDGENTPGGGAEKEGLLQQGEVESDEI